jgi:hypothetical protein
LKILENKGELLNLHSYREFSLSCDSLSTIQLKNTYSIMSNNPSSKHTEERIERDVPHPEFNSTGITPELTSYQPDNYDLTLGWLSSDLFIYVACHLCHQPNDPKHEIAPLLCVCKKMTLRVLRELCHITGYCPNVNSWGTSCQFKPKLSHIVVRSSTFYLCPLSISYDTSPWWDMFENPRLIIRRLIINYQSEVTYSKPSSNLWDLSNLNSLVIEMPKRFARNEQISLSETGNPSLLEEFLDQDQLPSLKEVILLEMYIAPETWKHLNSNLEFIRLIDCQLGLVDYQLGLPQNVNLRKFKYLKKFTIFFKPAEDASRGSCLDLTKCTMEFPGIFERLKFKDYLMLKVM